MKTFPLITSTENKYYQLFRNLNESKYLKKEKSFLVSGSKLVAEFIRKDPMSIKGVLSTEEQNPFLLDSQENLNQPFSLIEKIKHLEHFQFSKKLMNDIDTLGTHAPLLWVEQKEIPTWDASQKFNGLELFCPLGDPQNLGAVIRSGWALGAARVVLLQESANPFLPKCWKASAGTIWDMPLVKGPSLNELTIPMLGLDMKGSDIWDFKWPAHSRLLLGEEGQGLPKNLDLTRISINMQNNVESLNVAVAASLAISQFTHFSKKGC